MRNIAKLLLVSVLSLIAVAPTGQIAIAQTGSTSNSSNQDVPASRAAYLDVSAQRGGATNSELTIAFPIQGERDVSEALFSVLGCASTDWRMEGNADVEYAIAGKCRLTVKTARLETSGTIDLSSLREVLAKKGVTDLFVNFNVDKSQFLICQPHSTQTFVLDDSNECVYKISTAGPQDNRFGFAYGYHTIALLEDGAILAGVLFFPIPLTFWLRRKAMLAPDENREAIWFAYLRYRSWGVIGGFLLWWTAIDLLGIQRLYSYVSGALPMASGPLSFVLPVMGLWVPPALIYALASSLSGPIQKLTGSERTEREIVSQSLWAGANLVVPLSFCLMGLGFISYSVRLSVICFFAWYIMFFFGRTKLVRASGLEPHALTVGELRDRAFSIASKAHVGLTQVYVLPAQRIRMANAFAHSKRNVLLTDYLLKNLSKREVDAVLGHEITHLQHKHSRTRGMLVLIGLGSFGFVSAWANSFLPDRFPTGPAVLVVILMLSYLFSRRNEFSADKGSVNLTGDPEAMITSLVKISKLNTLPIHWNHLNEPAMTHPSTMRRIFAIAKAGGVAPERIPQMIGESALSPTETYELPATVAPMGKLFSTRFKQNAQNFYAWASLFSSSVVPATLAFVLVRARFQGERLWFGYAAGFLVALTISLVIGNRTSMHGHAKLDRDIRGKAADEGLPPEAVGGLLIGLGPDATPRIYENNWSWDVGLLSLTPDRLVYWGEEAQFAVSRDQISRVVLGRGPASWFRTPAVYISWNAADGAERTFNLRPANVNSLYKMGKLTRVLGRDLDNWHLGRPAESDSLISAHPLSQGELVFPAPAFGEVSSRSIRSLVTRRTLFITCFWVGVAASGVAVIFGLHFMPDPDFGNLANGTAVPLAGWYVLCSAWLLSIIQLVPCFRYREPKPRNARANAVGSVPAQS